MSLPDCWVRIGDLHGAIGSDYIQFFLFLFFLFPFFSSIIADIIIRWRERERSGRGGKGREEKGKEGKRRERKGKGGESVFSTSF